MQVQLLNSFHQPEVTSLGQDISVGLQNSVEPAVVWVDNPEEVVDVGDDVQEDENDSNAEDVFVELLWMPRACIQIFINLARNDVCI